MRDTTLADPQHIPLFQLCPLRKGCLIHLYCIVCCYLVAFVITYMYFDCVIHNPVPEPKRLLEC